MTAIPADLKYFLDINSLIVPNKDIVGEIARQFAKSHVFEFRSDEPIWEFGFVHGQVSSNDICRVARNRPDLIVARDAVDRIEFASILCVVKDVRIFAHFFGRFENEIGSIAENIINLAIYDKNLDLFVYVFGKGFTQHCCLSEMFDQVGKSGDLRFVKFLRANFSEEFKNFLVPILTVSARFGHAEIVEYIFDEADLAELVEKTPADSSNYWRLEDAIEVAIQNGYYEIVKLFHSRFFITRDLDISPGCIFLGIKFGNFRTLEYVLKNIRIDVFDQPDFNRHGRLVAQIHGQDEVYELFDR